MGIDDPTPRTPPALDEVFGGDAEGPLHVGGRYVLGPLLGTGGVGAVYRAHDPELGRDVALKVLRAAREDLDASMLLLEAKTIANLSHPNVVEIYDVGLHVGRGGVPQVFFVMELVAGEDLQAALSHRRWSADRIVDVFIAAGRGLSAAHAAGFAHRDFKPHNVLVGDSGAVKVADFGAGSVEGTPRYMSPEQRAGSLADPRSDQFSFCVALYEALEDVAPHDDPDGPLREPRHSMTRRIWPALRRGLAPEPKLRFASIDDLLAELQRLRPRRGRWTAAAAGGAVAIAAVAMAGETPAPCPTEAAFREELWSGARREEIRAAMAAVSRRSDEVWGTIAPPLDAFASGWATERARVCRALRDDTEDTATIERTLACLERRERAFSTLVGVFEAPDRDAVDRAPPAVRALPGLASCLHPETAQDIPEPVDPQARARVRALATDLSRIRALESAGRYRDAAVLGESTLSAAEELGHPPVIAEAAYRLGVVLGRSGEHDRSARLLQRAAFAALETEQNAIVAGAAIKLIAHYAELEHMERIEEWRRHAMAAIERGHLSADIEARLHLELGAAAYRHNDLEQARRESEEAVRLYAASVGEDDPEYATALNNLGGIAFALGDQQRGVEASERAAEIRSRLLGPTHPSMITSMSNLGSISVLQHRLDDAERYLAQARRALEFEQAEPDHRHVTLWMAEGALAREQGRLDDSVRLLERCLALARAQPATVGLMQTFRTRSQLLATYIEARREDDAQRMADTLVATCEATQECGKARLLRAMVWAEFGHLEEARAERDRARAAGATDAEYEDHLRGLLNEEP